MRDLARSTARRPITLWVLLGIASVFIVVFAWLVARHLTNDSRRASASYARVFRAQTSTAEGAATEALLDQMREIRREGIPIVITNRAGAATDTANLPRSIKLDSPEMSEFVAGLDAQNSPIVEPTVGTVHFGAPPVRRTLRWILGFMVGSLLLLLGAGVLARRADVRASQDRVFVAMARESAHQLGTPLTSLAGWIESLRSSEDAATREVAEHIAADYRRLDRVSRRFERIGQPPRQERVDVSALAAAAAAYFRPRMPRLANTVQIVVTVTSHAPEVDGEIRLIVSDEPEWVVLAVEDDGPGVPQPIAGSVFEPGVSTKTGGWGLGLSLTRRIVEEGFRGRITIEPSSAGARFVLRLPRRPGQT